MQVRVVVLLQNAHRRMRMATKRTTRLQKNKLHHAEINRPCHNSLNKGQLHQP